MMLNANANPNANRTSTRGFVLGLLLLAACADGRSKQVPQIGSTAGPAPAQPSTTTARHPATASKSTTARAGAKHIVLPTAQPAAGGTLQPSAAPTAAPASNVAGVTLKRAVFAKRIVDREPVELATSFSRAETPKVWVFLELENATQDPLTLDVRWESSVGPSPHGVQLSVPKAKRWRTQAFISTDKKPGKYRCVIRTAQGTVLFNQPVEITA